MLLQLVLFGFLGLSLGQEVCYPPCGCFSMGSPWDEWLEPESPEEQEFTWELFTASNPTSPIVFDLNSAIPSQYNPNKPTKFMIHGWNSQSSRLYNLRDAFLQSGFDYNIVVMDWSTGAGNIIYPQSASNVRVVGACSSEIARRMVEQGGRWNDMHCIGHSLGAQSCGHMGKASGGIVGRVTGLDPAGPEFDTNNILIRLDKSDSQYMDNIHSNGDNFISLGLGRPVGHVDFFPNKGGPQPPCVTPACDHSICIDYMEVSIRQNCNYNANPCQSEEDADGGACESCTPGVNCQIMGFFSNTMPGRGSFFLRTVEDHPYCE